MSGPTCLRAVFRACRPTKSSTIPLRTTWTQCRTYADNPKVQGLPETNSIQEQKEVIDELPETQPPKRAVPPAAAMNQPTLAKPDIASLEAAFRKSDDVEEAGDGKKKRKNWKRLLPSNVIAAWRTPLKHPAPHGVPVASIQLRSYSVRSLEFYADFALRAAFYLNLPARGPVPLPKRIERWTMPRSNFVHKKSQENFERITYKRLITIMDGEKSAVEVLLAALRKWQFYGVGMKANVWEWEGLDVASKMESQGKELEKDIDAKLANFGWNKSVADSQSLDEMLQKQGAKQVGASMMHLREASRHHKNPV